MSVTPELASDNILHPVCFKIVQEPGAAYLAADNPEDLLTVLQKLWCHEGCRSRPEGNTFLLQADRQAAEAGYSL